MYKISTLVKLTLLYHQLLSCNVVLLGDSTAWSHTWHGRAFSPNVHNTTTIAHSDAHIVNTTTRCHHASWIQWVIRVTLTNFKNILQYPNSNIRVIKSKPIHHVFTNLKLGSNVHIFCLDNNAYNIYFNWPEKLGH